MKKSTILTYGAIVILSLLLYVVIQERDVLERRVHQCEVGLCLPE